MVAKQIEEYKQKHIRPFWNSDIEGLVDSKINELLLEIQTKIDPDDGMDLGGEADFFLFDDGTGFDHLKKSLTEKLATYIDMGGV